MSCKFSMIGLSVTIALMANEARAQTALPSQLRPFLQQFCFDCHAKGAAEGELDLQAFSDDLTDAEVRRRWVYLHDRVANGEMPPKSAKAPEPNVRAAFLKNLSALLTRADRSASEVVLRRLNRREYANTVSDLFGVPVDVSRLLLDDAKENGFDNIGSELSLSAEQMTLYVDAADVVLDRVLGPVKPPTPLNATVNFATTRRGAGESERKLSDGVVLFSGAKFLPLYDLSAPSVGLYKIRVQARAEQTDKPVVMHIRGGGTGRIGWHTAGFFEVPPGKLTTFSFTDRALERGDNLGFGLVGGFPYWSVKPDSYKGPGLFIGDISIEGPIDESAESRRKLLGDVDLANGGLNDIRDILKKTMRRAFRRSVGNEDVAPYAALAEQAMENGEGARQALRLALKGMLCAPEFLFLEERLRGNKNAASVAANETRRIDDFAIASRLAYFCWSSLPDEQILTLAEQGKLSQSTVLADQLERMLNDPKAERFVSNFVGQWLRVRDIDFTVPDRRLYPEYNELLRKSMIDETESFFREILKHDLSIQNFIDSDFLMVNQPLAEFYGLPPVKGLQMRRVSRPKGSLRGGVLTHASVLKVSADGTRTSPVLRGVWILNHFFGTPPPPPPASVSTVQPDVRGATTIREELAKHRADSSCSRCHRKIDPPGFALESFDVLGAQRDWYRVRGQGGKYLRKTIHPFAPTNVQYQQGPSVDASGAMPDGRTFADIREYKRMLLSDDTAMARALTRHLLSYSLGRKLGFADRPQVEKIVVELRSKNDGLRSLIRAIVQSDAFQEP